MQRDGAATQQKDATFSVHLYAKPTAKGAATKLDAIPILSENNRHEHLVQISNCHFFEIRITDKLHPNRLQLNESISVNVKINGHQMNPYNDNFRSASATITQFLYDFTFLYPMFCVAQVGDDSTALNEDRLEELRASQIEVTLSLATRTLKPQKVIPTAHAVTQEAAKRFGATVTLRKDQMEKNDFDHSYTVLQTDLFHYRDAAGMLHECTRRGIPIPGNQQPTPTTTATTTTTMTPLVTPTAIPTTNNESPKNKKRALAGSSTNTPKPKRQRLVKVDQWVNTLENEELRAYAPLFAALDEQAMKSMTDQELARLGIVKVEHCNEMMNLIRKRYQFQAEVILD